MSGAQKPRVVLRQSGRFGHLRYRFSLHDCGLMSWALLPLDEAAPGADVPLVSGFLDQGQIDDLSPAEVGEMALSLQVFLDQGRDMIEAGAVAPAAVAE
jgi:hypothetical protein